MFDHLRLATGLTNTGLAEELNVNRRSIQQWENCLYDKLPNSKYLLRIAELYAKHNTEPLNFIIKEIIK